MEIGKIYLLDKHEQKIIELCATQRHNNKINNGWDGHKTVNKKSIVTKKIY